MVNKERKKGEISSSYMIKKEITSYAVLDPKTNLAYIGYARVYNTAFLCM